MNLPAFMLSIGLMAGAGAATAAEEAKPGLPDLDYCARRDADPRKCVIRDSAPPQRALPQEPASGPPPAGIDQAYCSRRDADPRECVIKDGPPREPIVHKKAVAPPAQQQAAPAAPVSQKR